MSESTLYREITDEERLTWSASRYTTISAVPVERCEHGNIFRHPVCVVYDSPIAHPTGRMTWCPGAVIGGDDE